MDQGNAKEYGECRCCLTKGNHHNIMKEYTYSGVQEIYYDMFFNSLNLNLSKDPRLSQLICSNCINSLRDADNFRKLVVNTEQTLILAINDQILGKDTELNDSELMECEIVISDNEYTHSEHEIITEMDENIIIEDYSKEVTAIPTVIAKTKRCQPHEVKIKQAKGIEDLIATCTKPMQIFKTPNGRNIMILTKPNHIKDNKIERPTRRKPTKETKIKQKWLIAKTYDKKTSWIKKQLIPNIHKVLTNSTILPFRNHSYFYCYYCENCFVSFQQLRDHTISLHKDISISDIKLADSTLVKVDISNLKCKLCATGIKTVEELIKHLVEKHKMSFYDTPNKLPNSFLPFDFSDDSLKCHICQKEFRFFKPLCRHMAEHYGSYICDVCGKRCLAQGYLNYHKKYAHGSKETKDGSSQYQRDYIKTTGVQCPMCPQTFYASKRYIARRKHMADAHGMGIAK